MNLTDLQQQALDVADKYKEKNRADGHKEWDASARMAGFVADIGELSELVMVKQGLRSGDGDIDAKIAHELGDCLWSLLVLANDLGIDLESAFLGTIQNLHKRLGM